MMHFNGHQHCKSCSPRFAVKLFQTAAMRVTVNLTSFSSDCDYQPLSSFFSFLKSWKLCCGIFILLFEQMESQKIFIWCSLQFTALEVYPTTSVSKKPGKSVTGGRERAMLCALIRHTLYGCSASIESMYRPKLL